MGKLGLPLLERDPTFSTSLVELIRKNRATAVLTCGYTSERSDTPLRNLLMEQADCVLEFGTIKAGECYRQLVRAVKTRQMDHRSGRFQLEVTKNTLRLGNETLYRENAAGGSDAVPVSLFLHSETLIHRRYNTRLTATLQTSISSKAAVRREVDRFDSGVLGFARSSAVDEVQILQLDEFQLPKPNRTDSDEKLLFEFDTSERKNLLSGRLDGLHKAVTSGTVGFAVPYYQNVSLLAYRRSHFGRTFPRSWERLAEECRRWESDNPDPRQIFFGCQVAHADRFESYNCIFLEILSSLSVYWRKSNSQIISLADWFCHANQQGKGERSPLGRALQIFRQLVKRCNDLIFQQNLDTYNRVDRSEDDWEKAQFETNRSALVWRQWYNTLNQLLADFRAKERNDIHVRPLFGGPEEPDDFITTAGEWYLAVPNYSASPEFGLDIIEFLTSSNREMQRLGLGVGLPTRGRFYDLVEKGVSSVSPYFEMEMPVVRKLVEDSTHVIRRSRFVDYSPHSDVLASHLLRTLQLPVTRGLDKQIGHIIESMLHGFRLVGNAQR
jgi:hypothetical protein